MKRRYVQRASMKGSVFFSVADLTGDERVLNLTAHGCKVEDTSSPQKVGRVMLSSYIP